MSRYKTEIKKFAEYLQAEERSRNTINKYTGDLKMFFSYLGDRPLRKEVMLEYKELLMKTHAESSVNSILAALNKYLEWSGRAKCKVKPLKLHKMLFMKPERELNKAEYVRLVKAAGNKKDARMSLILQTICASGIRVSELEFITVQALRERRAVVDCKGKSRVVLLPEKLCCTLKKYCRQKKIYEGAVFKTKNGTPLNRSNVWRDMKALCEDAKVESLKVFPHNLRHLYAKTYYQLEKDISRLADLLGHSSIATTRIYTMESGSEHVRQLERMGLVLGKI